MQHRDFVATLVGGFFVRSLTVEAQQLGRVSRIGALATVGTDRDLYQRGGAAGGATGRPSPRRA